MGAWKQQIILCSLNSLIRFFCQNYLVLPLALSALELEDQLLGGLGLLPQDRLGLTSKSLLLAIIPENLDTIVHLLINILIILNQPPSSQAGSGKKEVGSK